MKRILLILLLLAGSAVAQMGNMVLIPFSGAPTGTCSNIMFALNTSNGDFYNCLNGAWNKIATGGGSVISGTGTANTLTKWTAGSTIGNANPTDDGTTFTVTEPIALTLTGGTKNFLTVTDNTPNGDALVQLTASGAGAGTSLISALGGTGSNFLLRGDGSISALNGTFAVGAAGHVTEEGVTSTGATGTGKLVFDTAPTLSSLAFSGSAPAVTTSGTTPYLNMNTLVKGAINTCTFNFTTGQFTLAASPLSMCSPTYTLPNAALTWYYTCSFTWSVTAGTTPTLTFGQTFAQAPSAANEWQNIFTSNAGVSIQASQAVTTNSSMTATGSLTTSATLFQATIGGTFTSSATSGTFSPTATLTGTNAVGTLRGGCVIQ